jgi:capsular polysaccharide biosynthesis protein
MQHFSVISIRDLLQDRDRAAAVDAGITGVDVIACAGSYTRTQSCSFGLGNATFKLADFIAARNATTQRYEPVYRISLEDAILTGQGTVMTRNGNLVRESALEFLAHRQVPTGLKADDDGRFSLTSTASRHIDAPCLLVKRPWWRNYGHWLVDGAALLAMISALRMPSGWHIIIGAHENPAMRTVMRETIDVVAPNIPVLEHPDNENWTFSSLDYVTPVHVPPLFKLPQAFSSLRALFLNGQMISTGARRLFAARQPGTVRGLQNQDDIVAECSKLGFEVIYPERHSIREQAMIFHSAEAVVGVKGAALTNILFCGNPAGVIVLAPGDFPDPFFWDLAGQSRMHYVEIFGELVSHSKAPSHNPFTIDPADFMPALKDMLTAVSRSTGPREPGSRGETHP